MIWRINWTDDARRELRKLDKQTQERILQYMRKRAASDNPRQFGAGLTANLSGCWRYRVGDYRVICDLNDDIVTVLVLRVGHRKDVY